MRLEQYELNSINVGGVNINFQRTCRVPAGKMNSLPAGLGSFPVYNVSDFRSGCPAEWKSEGFFIPMYRQEAMWMHFGLAQPAVDVSLNSTHTQYRKPVAQQPRAMVIGAGNINALSGKQFFEGRANNATLDGDAQNYVVIPTQPWLDGWKAEDGKVYQFVAAELGSGETVEGQLTGKEDIGGIQFVVYEPKEGENLATVASPPLYLLEGCAESFGQPLYAAASTRGFKKSLTSMGLGKGGEINQKVYPDPYGVNVWQTEPTGVDLVYMISSEDFKQVTGHATPPTPVTYEKYQELGLPWFDLHDGHLADAPGSGVFDDLKPVGEGKKSGDLFDKLK